MFFFFKQKTAYELRISDWSSDVCSSDLPLMKLVGRGDTTVVDAYLSPILRRYVDRVADQLGAVRLMFMQSNGGLTGAHLFQGKDAILSGPRSEERRVGKEGVSTCSSRGWQYI